MFLCVEKWSFNCGREIYCVENIPNNGYQSNHISNKLRELGRPVFEILKINVSMTLHYVINPAHFDDTVKAVNLLFGWDDKVGKMEAPSTRIEQGFTFKKLHFF